MAKLFVKKDGGFCYLGEGAIYTKAHLESLNEIEAAMTGTVQNVSAGAQQAQKQMNQSPNVTGVKADTEQLDGNSKDNPTPINVDTKNPESIRTAQTMINSLGNKASDATVNYFDGTKNQGQNNNMLSEKNNCISFTKKELNKFLRTI